MKTLSVLSSYALSRVLPRGMAYQVADAASFTSWQLKKSEREAICRNLSHVMKDFPESKRIQQACKQMYRGFGRMCVDTLYDTKTFKKPLLDKVRCNRLEYLSEAGAHKKGVIILSAHVGNWEIGAMALAQHKYPISIVAHPYKSKIIQQLFTYRRRFWGVETIPSEKCSIKVVKALKRREVIGMLGDRLYGLPGHSAVFFGEQTLLPKGPVLFSLLSGAPIVLSHCKPNLEHTAYDLTLHEPLYPPKVIDKKSAAHYQSQISLSLEKLIKEDPTQWFVFEDIWPSSNPNPSKKINLSRLMKDAM